MPAPFIERKLMPTAIKATTPDCVRPKHTLPHCCDVIKRCILGTLHVHTAPATLSTVFATFVALAGVACGSRGRDTCAAEIRLAVTWTLYSIH